MGPGGGLEWSVSLTVSFFCTAFGFCVQGSDVSLPGPTVLLVLVEVQAAVSFDISRFETLPVMGIFGSEWSFVIGKVFRVDFLIRKETRMEEWQAWRILTTGCTLTLSTTRSWYLGTEIFQTS